MRGPGAVVANHSSWLDILTMNAAMPVFFVSKAEVAGWPGINILTGVTDTHFVARDPRLARAQAEEIALARAGHRLLFFPRRHLDRWPPGACPFKPTLFRGFLAPELPAGLAIQPMTAIYHAPPGADPRFYGWWGEMDLGPHLLAVLAAPRQGRVDIVLHPADPRRRSGPQVAVARRQTAIRTACPSTTHDARAKRCLSPRVSRRYSLERPAAAV